MFHMIMNLFDLYRVTLNVPPVYSLINLLIRNKIKIITRLDALPTTLRSDFSLRLKAEIESEKLLQAGTSTDVMVMVGIIQIIYTNGLWLR